MLGAEKKDTDLGSGPNADFYPLRHTEIICHRLSAKIYQIRAPKPTLINPDFTPQDNQHTVPLEVSYIERFQ